ncbi:sugar transferase [Erythrobacter sp. CCH5-A1]|uniref:sugar transferase n=1 Tax=Erythrobacter sp. CCH5-A1 TaxID=1768792 RepID=UPI0018D25974|nr:sugar transferase [Erythrobacter sp. CCH5-A1]
MLLVDGVLIHFSFALAALIWEGVWAQSRAMITAQVILPVFFTIALYNGTYGLRALDSWTFASRKTLIALTISAALILFVGFYTKSVDVFSRGMVTLGLALSAVLLVAIRRVVAIIIAARWGGRVSNRVVIDDGGPSFAFAGADLVSAADYNLDPSSHDPFMLDRLGTLLRNQDQVVVSCPRERRQDWAFLLKCAGVYGEIVSEPAHELGAVGVHRYDALDRTTLVVSTGPLALRARVLKRAFDMFKFRSMREEKLDHDGNRSASRDDDRITRIGAFIRRTSIDELPQLLNVLKGDMSIVGPRPHALGSRANNKYFWDIDRKYWQRHCLKPGLTGLAQVRGHRGATEHEKDLTDRLQSDLEYIASWSLRHDIGIVLRTVMVLQHKNAF